MCYTTMQPKGCYILKQGDVFYIKIQTERVLYYETAERVL